MVALSSFFVLMPLYLWPTKTNWDPLFASIAANPTVPFQIIINPNSGPGSTTYPDPAFIPNLAKLNAYNNTNLLGYVRTGYASRNLTTVESEVSRYAGWAKYGASDIHIDGIFFDEATDDTKYLSYMASLYHDVKNTYPNNATVITNPGTPISSSFYAYADFVNPVENTLKFWKSTSGGVKSIAAAERPKSTIMLNDYTSSSAQMLADIEAIQQAGYAGLYISNDENYQAIPSTWATFCANVGKALKAAVATSVKTPSSDAASASSKSTTSSTKTSSTSVKTSPTSTKTTQTPSAATTTPSTKLAYRAAAKAAALANIRVGQKPGVSYTGDIHARTASEHGASSPSVEAARREAAEKVRSGASEVDLRGMWRRMVKGARVAVSV